MKGYAILYVLMEGLYMLRQGGLNPCNTSEMCGSIVPPGSQNADKYSHVTVGLVSSLLEEQINKNFNIVLLTVHGSHLYGFETEESDVDLYVVVDFIDNNVLNKKFVKQFVVENQGTVFDVNVVGWQRWVGLLNKGRHQACEAFFSPYAYVHSNYAAYCEGFVMPAHVIIESFISVVKSFTVSGFNCPKNVDVNVFVEPVDNERNVKKLRHAARLAKHVKMVYETGTFTPHVGVEGFPDFHTIHVKDYVEWLHEVSGFHIFDSVPTAK